MLVASSLTRLEFERALIRLSATRAISAPKEATARRWLAEVLRELTLVPIDDGILSRAGQPFPVEPVRSLDAIHLATIEALREKLRWFTVATHDARVRENALALGLRVVPDLQ